MPEGFGILDGFAEAMAVFDVATEVADARVEDVVERIFAQEEVANDAHATRVFVVDPEPPQISDSVDCLFHLDHLVDEVIERHPRVLAYIRHHILVLFDKTDNSLTIVLGNVFRLVFNLLF